MSTYRWDPSQIIVNQGDEVTLEILGVNGADRAARHLIGGSLAMS